MASDKACGISSDPRQWRKIFNCLVHMLHTQQTQLESLVKERKVLENRIQIQYDRWVSDIHLLEDRISLTKRDLSQAELRLLLEAAKSDLVVGLKQREGILYKLKFECAESDLDDLKSSFDILTSKCSEQKEKSGEKIKGIVKEKGGGGDGDMKSMENTNEEERHSKILEGEVKKLKRAYEKLTSKNNSEVSALLSERDFVWNQFKKMESDYASLLKCKRVEVQQGNEKIEKLLASMEALQSSNNEKDEIIVKLKADVDKLEAVTDKSNREISRLSRELELLRNFRSASVTPVLNRCTVGSSTCSLGSQNGGKDRMRPPVKPESAGSQASDPAKNPKKECRRSSKRRAAEAMPSSETPKLFSSTFKVPKLKNASPCLV